MTKNSIRDRYKPISKKHKNPRSSTLISISDWVFGHVWSCLTLFIMKMSHKSDELKK
jgi:hypothetical protein